MSQLLVDSFRKPEPFELVFLNQKPILASDVAALLSALSADYRQINPGHELEVRSLRQGSLYIQLGEALLTAAPYFEAAATVLQSGATAAESIERISGFISRIWNWSNDTEEIDVESPSVAVIRSIEKVTKIGIDKHCEVRINYRDQEVQISPTKALKINKKAKTIKTKLRKMQPELPPGVNFEQLVAPSEMVSRLASGSVFEISAIIEALDRANLLDLVPSIVEFLRKISPEKAKLFEKLYLNRTLRLT